VKILFYSSAEGLEMGIGARLRRLVPNENLAVYRSIEELAQELHRLYDRNAIAILQVRDREELLRIISLRELLHGVRVILLIPDREETTISLAHSLRPRFLGSSENDFSDTLSVVRKMIGYGQEVH
jgi:hypothetical protein